MGLVEAIALGLVQGLTEFFPVSSSGHLVLAQSLLDVTTPGVSFEVLVHLASVTAVIVVYRRRLSALIFNSLKGQREALRYVVKLFVASIPAGLAGVLLGDAISHAFDSPPLVAVSLLITGAIVYSTRWLIALGERTEPSWWGSLGIGIAQAASLLPGISRSGATVAAALGDRTERVAAAEFSFLLSVPAILGASVLEVPALVTAEVGLAFSSVAAAFLSSFAAAVVAIVLFVRWLRGGRLHVFAYYCWVVGGGYLLYTLAAA